MAEPPFAVTTAERGVLEEIRRVAPEILTGFAAWLGGVLDDFVRTSPGRVVTEAEADRLLRQLHAEAAGRMADDMAPWARSADFDLNGRRRDHELALRQLASLPPRRQLFRIPHFPVLSDRGVDNRTPHSDWYHAGRCTSPPRPAERLGLGLRRKSGSAMIRIVCIVTIITV